MEYRAATEADAPGVAQVWQAAARAAFGSFLDLSRLPTEAESVEIWRDRIRDSGALWVAADPEVCGFVAITAEVPQGLLADGASAPPGTGLLRVLYAHPRVWGGH